MYGFFFAVLVCAVEINHHIAIKLSINWVEGEKEGEGEGEGRGGEGHHIAIKLSVN